MGVITNSGRNLLQIINDILDFSKIEAGKLMIEKTQFELAPFCRHLEQMLRPIAEKKGLDFGLFVSDDLPKVIETDSTRLNQCLINLVGNAIKFTDNGYVHINISSESRAEGLERLCIDIEDTGLESRRKNRKRFLSPLLKPTLLPLGNLAVPTGVINHSETNSFDGRRVACKAGPIRIDLYDYSAGSAHRALILKELISVPICDLRNIVQGSTAIKPNRTLTENGSEDCRCARVLVAEDSKANQILMKNYWKDPAWK